MTLEASTSRAQYATNATTGPWTVPFYFLANSHLQFVYTTAAGVDTTLTLDVDYTVTGAGNPAGGSITTTTAYASGGLLTVVRNVPLTQLTDYVEGGPFPATAAEDGYDKLTMIAQQQSELLSRAFVVPIGDTSDVTLPSAADRANTVLAFDSLGAPTVLVPTSGTAADVLIQLAASDGADKVGIIQPGTGPYIRTVGRKSRDWVSFFDFFDSLADEDEWISTAGTLDASYAMSAFLTWAPAGGCKLLVPRGGGVLSQTHTISKPISFLGSSRENTNGSRFLKKSTVSGDLFTVSSAHVSFENMVLTGQAGNVGNLITVLAEYFRATGVQLVTAGNDSIQIGNSTGADNCNHFTLTAVDSLLSGRHGFYLDSQTTDAGGGALLRCSSYQATGDGFKFDRSQLNSAIGCVAEGGTGVGLHLAAGARDIWWFGGDCESNGGGNYTKNAGALRCNVIAPWVDDTIGTRVNNNAAISIPNAAATALTFNTEEWDTDAIHSTSVNTGRLTAVTKGKYMVNAVVGFAANATGIRKVLLKKSGATYFGGDTRAGFAVEDCLVSVSAPVFLDVGDYVEVEAYQTSGGALNVVSTAGVSPIFTMTRQH